MFICVDVRGLFVAQDVHGRAGKCGSFYMPKTLEIVRRRIASEHEDRAIYVRTSYICTSHAKNTCPPGSQGPGQAGMGRGRQAGRSQGMGCRQAGAVAGQAGRGQGRQAGARAGRHGPG